MGDSQFKALDKYVASGRNNVSGWFAFVDAEICRTILTAQVETLGVCGAVVEIGVHHGKSFIALCLGLRPEERAYCIDVFENQHLNKDASGRGNRTILERNLARFGIPEENRIIRQASSFEVTADEIKNAVGPVRFFSVDGGHWLEIVANDLALAEATLAHGGVIALDDFHRLEWPNVSAGYFAWYTGRKEDIIPLALGFNKLYLCERSWVGGYQKVLSQNSKLGAFLVKQSNLQGVDLPVYGEYVLPEFPPARRFLGYFRIHQPKIFPYIKATMDGAKKATKAIRKTAKVILRRGPK